MKDNINERVQQLFEKVLNCNVDSLKNNELRDIVKELRFIAKDEKMLKKIEEEVPKENLYNRQAVAVIGKKLYKIAFNESLKKGIVLDYETFGQDVYTNDVAVMKAIQKLREVALKTLKEDLNKN